MSKKTEPYVVDTLHGFKARKPRLIPSLQDGEREGRLTSIFLAVLKIVPEYRKVIMASLGHRVGTRTKLDAWNEIVFSLDGPKGPKKDNQRPDGAIILETGRKSWRALVEAKANSAELDAQQVEAYLKRARDHNFDALITISNQFVAMPTHHPLQIAKTQLRTVNLYHWSWTYLVTQARLLLSSDSLESQERRFILTEMVKYFEHEKSGVQGFTQMNEEWKELVDLCTSASSISHKHVAVQSTVASWHQEQRELCLKLWPLVRTEVDIRLPREHQKDPKKRLEADSKLLAKERVLRSEISVPNAAAPILLVIDIKGQQLRCSMTLKAPDDKKGTKARTRWLVNQLRAVPSGKDGDERVKIYGRRPGWTSDHSHTLAHLKAHPASFDGEGSQSGPPTSFEVRMEVSLGKRFSNRKVFIREVEALVPAFYSTVGERLKAWVPPAPRMITEKLEDTRESDKLLDGGQSPWNFEIGSDKSEDNQ